MVSDAWRVLFIDGTEDSAKAQKFLKDAGVGFLRATVPEGETDLDPLPRLIASEGSFGGLDNITFYAHCFGAKDLRSVPK